MAGFKVTTEAPFPFGHLDGVEAVAPETLSKVIVAPERVSHTILTGPNIPTLGNTTEYLDD